jgi:hypothetical protein
LLSAFAGIRRIPGLFIYHAGLKRALTYAVPATFSLFSLRAKSAVPFFAASNRLKIDQQANAVGRVPG